MLIFIVLNLITSSIFCSTKRNLLTDSYTRKFVSSVLLKDYSWINYPPYTDRDSWTKIPQTVREETIQAAKKHIGYDWPIFTATMYLEFTRTGNRSVIDQAISRRSKVLRSLVMAELFEGKGRFIDDIINGVYAYCEQTYWGASAHFYLYGFGHSDPKGSINDPYTILPDIDNPIIDLMASDVAADLAWVWYFFHKEFDKISPIISSRLKQEIENKILAPYYKRNDHWWMTGWGEGDLIFERSNWIVNNWTPWITSNILATILLIEDDPSLKLYGIYKTMISMDIFMNTYPSDGACDEGPSYWRHAGGKLFDYLYLFQKVTNGKVDIFNDELVKNIGRYIYRVYISNGVHYINWSNAAQQIHHDGGHILRFGEAINDNIMKNFGAYLLKESDFENVAISGSISQSLENLFNTEEWKTANPAEPLLHEFYFPDSELAIGRDKEGTIDGFYFAAWGNNNSGGHNHNDVGNCILYFNGTPVLVDVGRGGSGTDMHNLPLINGIAQSTGGKYKANNSKFSSTRKRVSFSTDIAKAYPAEANVEKWSRSYILVRNEKFSIVDRYQLSQNSCNTVFHFMTSSQTRLLKPGILKLHSENYTLLMKYNPSLVTFEIEENMFRNDISRIMFKMINNKLSGNISFEIIKADN